MIISYHTLKTLFHCQLPVEELTEKLTAQGIEVEMVHTNPPLEHFITAKVKQRLDGGYMLVAGEEEISLNTSEVLETETAYLLDNLGGSWALTTPERLGWNSVKKPLWVPSGLTLATAWEWDDTLIELSVTPNRGDCLSYLGIAREIFLALRQPFDHLSWVQRMKERYPVAFEGTTEAPVSVDPKIAHYYALMQVFCPRFMSPFWVQRFLLKHGFQPKLPAVDVGHYWMMLLGLPSHAFDAAAITGKPSVKYHQFDQPTSWQGLQGAPLQLHGTLPVMVDSHGQILCLPGAMGAADSASSESSQKLLIEAASFMPQAIRPLRSCVPVTTSSLRFERGVWRSGQNDLLELIAGMLCAFHPQVRCSQPHVSIKKQWEAPTLTTSKKQVEKLTGCAFEASVLEEIITLMGATCQDNQYRWQVPDWRFDLSLEQNFIGEIVRCYGLDSLSDPSRQTPPRPRRAVLSRVAIDPWLNHGAQEVVTYSFVPQSWVNISGPDNCPPDSCYVIQNPISDELSVMRPSLFPSLCDRLAFHQRHQLDLVPLVELAPVYHPSWPQRQRLRLSVAWPEKNSQRYWGSGHKETTFYDIKGLIEGILPAQVSFITGQEVSGSERLYHPQLQATLMLGSQCVGSFGLLDPRAAQQHDWPSAWLIELDAEFCEQQRPTPQYQSFSKMPCVVRDWAFIIPEKTKSSDLLSRVQGYDWPLCRSVRVFDFYVDGAGQRSVGLEVRFQAPDRSLTDEDLQQLSAHIIDDLSTHFGAKIRE